MLIIGQTSEVKERIMDFSDPSHTGLYRVITDNYCVYIAHRG